MKTTIEISDDLYHQATAEAGLSGRKLNDLIERGLRLVLEDRCQSPRRRRASALMNRACGIVDSGAPDLASNPGHLKGFGRR